MSRTVSSPRRRLSAVAAIVTVTACSAGPATDKTPDMTGATASADPARFEIDHEPVWSWTDDYGEVPVRLVELSVAGPLVMMTGASETGDGAGIAVADTTSGELLWALQALEPIDGLGVDVYLESGAAFAGPDDDPVVIVPYYAWGCLTDSCTPGSNQAGVLALDPRTGDVRWISPVDESNRLVAGGRSGAGVVATGPSTALYGDPLAALSEIRTTVLDPGDGTVRWSTVGAFPEHVTAQHLAAWTGSDELTFFDLASGDELAAVTAPFGGTVVHSAANLLAVETTASLRLINPEGGSLHAEIEHARGVVVDADTALVVFGDSSDPDRFASMAPGETEPTTASSPLPPGFIPRLVAGGRVFAHHADDGVTLVVDRTGAALSDRLPGNPVALTDDLLIMRQGRVVSAYQRVA